MKRFRYILLIPSLLMSAMLIWQLSNLSEQKFFSDFKEVGPRPWYLMHESSDYGAEKTLLWTKITNVLRSHSYHNLVALPLNNANESDISNNDNNRSNESNNGDEGDNEDNGTKSKDMINEDDEDENSNNKDNSEKSRDMMSIRQDAQNKYRSRLSTLRQGCSKSWINSLVSKGNDYWDRKLFLSEKYNFVYCTIAKCGSTTWLAHLARLNGIETPYRRTGGSEMRARKKAYLALKENFSLSTLDNEKLRFVFVRHPFQRIVSAFINKFVQNSPQYDIKELENDIIRTQRTTNKNSTFTGRVRFVELVRHLLLTWSTSRDPNSINVHFRPQWSICPFCQLDFDVLGHVETFDEDTNYIVQALNLTLIKTEKSLNSHVEPRRPKTKSPEQVLFSAITKKMVKGLYDMYRIDFELFGYDDFQSYLDMAKN